METGLIVSLFFSRNNAFFNILKAEGVPEKIEDGIEEREPQKNPGLQQAKHRLGIPSFKFIKYFSIEDGILSIALEAGIKMEISNTTLVFKKFQSVKIIFNIKDVIKVEDEKGESIWQGTAN